MEIFEKRRNRLCKVRCVIFLFLKFFIIGGKNKLSPIIFAFVKKSDKKIKEVYFELYLLKSLIICNKYSPLLFSLSSFSKFLLPKYSKPLLS